MKEHLTRQFDLIPEKCLDTQITIIGAGAIGSFTALCLAKMGFWNLTVWDFDKIEIENMNAQFYRFRDIGRPKVQALADLVQDFTGVRLKDVNDRYMGSAFKGIVVSAVDSMQVRQLIWESHLDHFGTVAVVDPRMGAETAMLFAMDPSDEKDQKGYQKSLYSDLKALQERCTAKATIYTATMLSGLVAQTVKNIAARQSFCRTATWEIRDAKFDGWMSSRQGKVSASELDAAPVSSAEALAEPV